MQILYLAMFKIIGLSTFEFNLPFMLKIFDWILEGVGSLANEAEIQKLKDDLAKENDATNTLLQELQDTRNQVSHEIYLIVFKWI